jgi:HlyD family secretion protein
MLLGLLATLLVAAYGVKRSRLVAQGEPCASTFVRRADIIARARVTGRIVPREEVFVRSLVSGVLDELKVRPGALVKRGDHIATVKVVADPVTLSEAGAEVRRATDQLRRAQREHERLQRTQGMGVSERDLAYAEDEHRAAKLALALARERLGLVAHGTPSEKGTRTTRITATISGTVLTIPVTVGDMISDTNSYRDGTAVAIIADMSNLLFKGQAEEAYAGKLRVGMPVEVRVGALPGPPTSASLIWVAPRATVEASAAVPDTRAARLDASNLGITRFEIWAELTRAPPGLRSGYSATADFILEKRQQVAAVEERALHFDDAGKVFASVLGPQGRIYEHQIRVGISDGAQVEVLSGLHQGTRVCYPDTP